MVQILKNNQNVGSEVSDASNLTLTVCLTFLTPANDIQWLCMSYVSWTVCKNDVVIVMSPTGFFPGTKLSNQSWCLWVFTNPCDERGWGGSDYNVPFMSQCKV